MLDILRAKLDGLPPTANLLYRTSRIGIRYKTKEGKEWQKAAACIFSKNYKRPDPYTGDVNLQIVFFTENRRRWDIDNRVKALMDALMLGGVIKDDGQVKALHVERVLSPTKETHTYVIVTGWVE